MKNQQVNVDYWAMLQSMFVYGLLTALGWLMLRLFNTVFMLPRRLRAHQDTLQDTLEELKRRYPDLNFTEEDIKEAEKELEELTTNENQLDKSQTEGPEKQIENTPKAQIEENKKTM
ncbi:hypothetical protein K1T71_005742 [Dendrolimus kikuchii]|uniref:Uncharacterized protein n=1 Tax=Dendrolimus kikuchii TaxID=765133 RepID=A0ACC1D535_9NEOP|nr:hypothetical protein K1T71_005742 [Dendrolimus kikuchii]